MMITSLGLVIIGGLLAGWLMRKIRLPGLLGMLLFGVLIGPHVGNLLAPELLDISSELRMIALVVILIRAGLGLKRQDLKQVGKTAVKMSILPGIMEGTMVTVLAMYVLGIPFIEGGMLGFILAAVSPAVVVPLMLEFSENGIGTKSGIPTLVLASASVDDIIAITVFSTFTGLYAGSHVNLGMQIISIPVSILLGSSLGILLGILLMKLFNKYSVRDTKKVLLILAASFLLLAIEEFFKSRDGFIKVAGLLGVMAIGYWILEKKPVLAKRLSLRYNQIWVLAEIILFVMVGAEVNVSLALDAGQVGLLIIALGLSARFIGVWISTMGSGLMKKERIFCMLAYSPKATVQAAIGSIPLVMGVPSGDMILAIAVMSIVITAPLGAIAIKLGGKRMLAHEPLASDKKKVS